MFKKMFFGTILGLLIGTSLALSLTEPTVKTLSAGSSTTLITVNREEVKQAVNTYRRQNGQTVLSANGLLDDSAQQRADYLCKTNTWSHEGWTDSLSAYRRIMYKAGENLAYGTYPQTARTIVDSWAASPAHNDNMLDPLFTEQGMGMTFCEDYQGSRDVIITVNHFGTPR